MSLKWWGRFSLVAFVVVTLFDGSWWAYALFGVTLGLALPLDEAGI